VTGEPKDSGVGTSRTQQKYKMPWDLLWILRSYDCTYVDNSSRSKLAKPSVKKY